MQLSGQSNGTQAPWPTPSWVVLGTEQEVSDNRLYEEIGRLTRGVHEACKAFESEATGAARSRGQEIPAEASHSLEYVVRLTEQAANKTLDLAEAAIPIARALGERLVGEEAIQAQKIQEFLYGIVLAQDYQDLSGQIIRRVVALVHGVESRLVKLLEVAAHVRELSGIQGICESDGGTTPATSENSAAESIRAEGPILQDSGRTDAVHGQDQVDDLLAKLGF